MLKKSIFFFWGAALFIAWNCFFFLFLWSRPPSSSFFFSSLTAEVIRLALFFLTELERQKELLRQIHLYSGALWGRRRFFFSRITPKPSSPPLFFFADIVLPVLVLAFFFSTVRRCLDKIFFFFSSAQRFPVIVSLFFFHAETARVIASYFFFVVHIRQPDLGDFFFSAEHRKFQGYYIFFLHYRWALGQIFRFFFYRAVIVVEDDLFFFSDFFEYFQAAFLFFFADRSLWCVSACFFFGKEQMVDVSQAFFFYRTDFFPGLGWFFFFELWDELEPKWPFFFWDDWMRQPEQRRDRSCIRPEISRTMIFFFKGVSHGQFFDHFFFFIKLNDRFVPFFFFYLSYLKKEEYELFFFPKVYAAPEVKVEELQGNRRRELGTVFFFYSGRDSFKAFAIFFFLMDDLKSGVPRFFFRGIVSFVYRGRRVYLAPPADWTGYDLFFF
ncbi:MGAT1 acetylglucosaminyltransferase, partial [Pterocles burchelli]|nr:MGAT1 acetylglucosaminyltransferase [Pterocles burchelli]